MSASLPHAVFRIRPTAICGEHGAFQQAWLERKEPNTGVFEIHRVPIHQDFLPYLIGPMAKWI